MPFTSQDEQVRLMEITRAQAQGYNQAITSLVAQFDEAFANINNRRSNIYGHPSVDFANVAKIAEVIEFCPDPLIRHVLYMIGVKMCRLLTSPGHLDSWIDIAGYARCAVQVLDRHKEGQDPRRTPTHPTTQHISTLGGEP